MKNLIKNNQGVTGIDIAVSVTLIIITLGIVMMVYSNYSNKVKEVNRNTTATNLAMKIVQNLDTMSVEDISKLPLNVTFVVYLRF